MRKSQFTEQKMVRILREADRAPVVDVARTQRTPPTWWSLDHR